jgi:hypothetical protein
MTWLAAGFEGLDDDHASAAARAWVFERFGLVGVARLRAYGWGHVQQLAHSRDRLGPIGACEQAVVADAVESFWQDVDEEAADELIDAERHRGVSAGTFDPVVLDLEGDLPPVECIRRRLEMATRWV